jgi:hypothetical protein
MTIFSSKPTFWEKVEPKLPTFWEKVEPKLYARFYYRLCVNFGSTFFQKVVCILYNYALKSIPLFSRFLSYMFLFI